MWSLLVVDAQNEFSKMGKRPVENCDQALEEIRKWVAKFREGRLPIAWIKHFNKPHESPAFVRGSWGSDFLPGLIPNNKNTFERLFEKDVYGAFSSPGLESWLAEHNVANVLIIGFYAHGCVSTSAREALIRGFRVYLDPLATGSCDMKDDTLGTQTADEVRRFSLLHLVSMGASLATGLVRNQIFSSARVDTSFVPCK
jgi:nicotinamidase-related amidase